MTVLPNFRILDESDSLKTFRVQFLFPKRKTGEDFLYFAGNSLGLQPKNAAKFISEELEDWARLGVEGHLNARHPWLPYHEFVTQPLARVVGALDSEVVAMNSVTTNLHLMMVSFYRPSNARHKIMIEKGAFPSDQYAVESQIKFHGRSKESSLIEIAPRSGEDNLRLEDILKTIEEAGSSLAMVLLGNVNYLTGQCYDIPAITKAAHRVGAYAGFDLAHGAGNLALRLHDDGADFAVWCNYKYMNAGPGAIGGAFVHEKHGRNFSLPRFAGWWAQNKKTRFQMGPVFDPLSGAEGWQLSNPPIFQLAALRASLEIFDQTTMTKLRAKSDALTEHLTLLLEKYPQVEIVTPRNASERGTQLSLRLRGQGRELTQALHSKGVICDFREPNILRVAPAPLYTRFSDLESFASVLGECLI